MNLLKRASANKRCSPTCLLLCYIMWFSGSWYGIGYGCDIAGGLKALLNLLEETRREMQKKTILRTTGSVFI